jgi:hypothetical protein
MGLTGQQINIQVGNLIEATATFVTPTGVSSTSSVGSLVTEIGVPLTGLSATSAVGSITPADVMGLTGQLATSNVGIGISFPGTYEKLDPKTSVSGYSTKTPKNTTGYTRKTSA